MGGLRGGEGKKRNAVVLCCGVLAMAAICGGAGRRSKPKGFGCTWLLSAPRKAPGTLHRCCDATKALGWKGAFIRPHPPSEELRPSQPSLSSGFLTLVTFGGKEGGFFMPRYLWCSLFFVFVFVFVRVVRQVS